MTNAQAVATDVPGRILTELAGVVVGNPNTLRLALAGVFAGGHLLIEDVPGVGKTTLALGLARILGLGFRRVQFTADMLPGDIVGGEVLLDGQLGFRPGPVFCQVVLADEINRAPPRTQSALLEAMEERQVSAAGTTHPLPAPFLVIATANPRHLAGTFALPEAQLDRFMMRLSLGLPDRASEREILRGGDRRQAAMSLTAVTDPTMVLALQKTASGLLMSDPVCEYVLDLLGECRANSGIPLSPRAGLAVQAAARGHALVAGRDHVVPGDIQAVLTAVLAHRLGEEGPALVAAALARVAVRI